MSDFKDEIKKNKADAEALINTVNKLHQKLGDLKQQQLDLAESGKTNTEYYKTITSLIDSYKTKIDATTESLSKTNTTLYDQERVLVAAQNRIKIWGDAYEGATNKINKSAAGINKIGEILGDSAKGFKPLTENLKSATEVIEPFKQGIAKANQAYTTFKEGMASGKGVMGSLKDVMPGLNNGLKTFREGMASGKGVLGSIKDAISGTTGGLKTFKIALAQTGIGIIIIAVAALIEKLKECKPIMDIINATTAAIGAVMGKLGDTIIGLFTNPIETIKNFGSSMVKTAKDAYQLSLAEEKLKTSLSAQEVANKGIEDQIDLLKQQIDNTKLSIKERTEALTKARAMEAKNYIDNKKLADQARANAIEDARIKGNIHNEELAALKERGTQYAKELLMEGKIHQEQFDAIKKADLDLIDLRKKHNESNEAFQKQQEQLADEVAKKKKEKDEAAAKAASDRAAKRKQLREKAATEQKEANDERVASIARMSQKVLEGYAKEINDTEEHFKQLKEKYKKSAATIEQLEREKVATLTEINNKFQTEGLAQLTKYQNELNQTSKDARQQALDQLAEDYRKKEADVEKIQKQNQEIADNIQNQIFTISSQDPSRLSKEQIDANFKRVEELNKKLLEAQKTVSQAKTIGDQLKANENKDTTKLKKSYEFEDKKSELETKISQDQADGKWKQEYEHKKQLLELETQQAIDAAQGKEDLITKIKLNAKSQLDKLDKSRLDAEVANQKKYVQALDSLATAVSGIFGKNTIAAKAAFKAHQAAAAAQVIIDTRQSVMGIWKANSGLPIIGIPKAIAETAIVVATGASNLATIMKQKPGFAQGGQFTSDGRGALLPGYSRHDNTNAYLRSGEAVVVSEAMRNPWARNLVSAINVAYGGRDFSVVNPGRGYAIGGIFTDGGNANRYYSQPIHDQKDLANTLAYQMINNFPPIYVDVKDVNNQQNILAQTVNRVNL